MCFEKSHQIFMVHYWYWLYYAEKSNEFAGFIFSPMHLLWKNCKTALEMTGPRFEAQTLKAVNHPANYGGLQ